MIARLPFPCENLIICKLSQFDERFRNHYLKPINVVYSGVCQKCSRISFTAIHHIVPIRHLGKNKEDNVSELCLSCHRKVENGSEDIDSQGSFFAYGIRKERKLRRKMFASSLNGDFNHELFFQKHLEIDSAIKQIIIMNDPERLSIKMQEWKDLGFIKRD